MTTAEAGSIEWPWRDLRKTVEVIVIPLSEYALIPTKSETSDVGLEICSPYSYTVEPFRTIQVRMDLLIKFPTGVTGKILELPVAGSLPLHVQQETIPSNFEDVVEISVKNTIGKRVPIQRGCKLVRMVPTTYYQPEILVKPLQPGTLVPPNLQVVPPPPYGHQHILVKQDQRDVASVPLQGGQAPDSLLPMGTLLDSLANPTMVMQPNDQGVTTIVSPLSNLPMQLQ